MLFNIPTRDGVYIRGNRRWELSILIQGQFLYNLYNFFHNVLSMNILMKRWVPFHDSFFLASPYARLRCIWQRNIFCLPQTLKFQYMPNNSLSKKVKSNIAKGRREGKWSVTPFVPLTKTSHKSDRYLYYWMNGKVGSDEVVAMQNS